MQRLVRHAGKEFGADIAYRWLCSDQRDIRTKDAQGNTVVVEGKKGCGENFYQNDVAKVNGQVPYEILCPNCHGTLRAWANLDNMRP